MASLIPWVVLLPLAAALAIAVAMVGGRAKGEVGEPLTTWIALVATLGALILLLAIDILALTDGVPGHVRFGTWFSSGAFEVPLSFTADALSLPIATLVAFIAFLTQLFSVHYLHREPAFHRYFFGLTLFSSGMLLIILAGNALFTFIGWEFAGVSSYLLIGYAHDRPTATGNALRAFVTNRIGDAGFLIGIVLCALWLRTLEWPQVAAGAPALGTLSAGMLAMGFVIAALAKSAQVPFAPWVARALEGPTPSSAIFYGSLMIHAGVYLLIRLGPVLELAPAVMLFIAVTGLITAVYGWLSSQVQTDVKSSLMYATTTQVGMMFFACGMGWFTLATWHLALHAAWRAYQFLTSPAHMEQITGPARPVGAWLAGRQGLYTAALHRFWLEAIGDRLLVQPTRALSTDINTFDEQVVSRLVGLPAQGRGALWLDTTQAARLGRARGAAGRLLEWTAERLHDFEQHLVFQGGGRLSRFLGWLGGYLLQVEALLERPRYLLLLIMATLVVIL